MTPPPPIPTDDLPAGPIRRYLPVSYRHAGTGQPITARVGDRVRFRPDRVGQWTLTPAKAQKLLERRGIVVHITERIYVKWNHRRCIDAIPPGFLESFVNECSESIELMATA